MSISLTLSGKGKKQKLHRKKASLAYLDGMLVVLVFLTVSTLHPDILPFSMSTKKMILLPLQREYESIT